MLQQGLGKECGVQVLYTGIQVLEQVNAGKCCGEESIVLIARARGVSYSVHVIGTNIKSSWRQQAAVHLRQLNGVPSRNC